MAQIARISLKSDVFRRFAEYIHVITPVSPISIVFGHLCMISWPDMMNLEGMLLTRSWLVYTSKEAVMITVVNRHSYTGKGVYIGRGTALGNKFSHSGYAGTVKVTTREVAIQKYAEWLKHELDNPNSPAYAMFERLAMDVWLGKDVALICSCAPASCHGDVIKRAIENLIKEVIS